MASPRETSRPTDSVRVALARPAAGPRARGSDANPEGRFERLRYERDDGDEPSGPGPATRLLRDPTRRLIARNDSPDLGFDASVNPYRGCEHGCAYCYARPTHEYLGFSAGLDFETRILVKEDAPRLLRAEFERRSWKAQPVALSGVTDPYQPAERRLGITRRLLRVFLEYRNPVTIVTKSALVTRDCDLLGELARLDLVSVAISVTTLDRELQSRMEPRAAPPHKRLAAIRSLREAGVPTMALVAPIIPGLNDAEIPAIVSRVADAGAESAGYVLLRLPHGLKGLFDRWLQKHVPLRRDKVLQKLREMRGGKLYDHRFSVRQRGTGLYADQIEAWFAVACRKAGLSRSHRELRTDRFRRLADAQQTLFE